MESTLGSLIKAAEKGEGSATEALFTALYSELHRLARQQLARGGRGITLGVTTLLHEAYLDMAGRGGTEFPDRARFMGYAARVMRALIIDHVRNRQAQKRGGLFELTSLASSMVEEAANERVDNAPNRLPKPSLMRIAPADWTSGTFDRRWRCSCWRG